MTPEEQRALAIECGASFSLTEILEKIEFAVSEDELSAYTAAVEANMREKCANECEANLSLASGSIQPGSVIYGMHLCADLIRSLK